MDSTWEQWKYHHEFFWNSFYRLAAVIAVLSVAPFLKPELFDPFPIVAFLFPALTAVCGWFGLLHLRSSALQVTAAMLGVDEVRRTWNVDALSRFAAGVETLPWLLFLAATVASVGSFALLFFRLRDRAVTPADIPATYTTIVLIAVAAAAVLILVIVLRARAGRHLHAIAPVTARPRGATAPDPQRRHRKRR
jgi:hypothetical protein